MSDRRHQPIRLADGEREPRWMHSGLLHYWTSVWLFSFSAPIKTDDSHFEAVCGRRVEEKEKKDTHESCFSTQRRTQTLQCSLNMFCKYIVDAQSGLNKGVIIPFFCGCFNKIKVTVQVLSKIECVRVCFNSLHQ